MQHELWAKAADAFNRQDFYHCHELLEALWLEAPPERKPALQGLIQLAGGYLKAERGQPGPALRLYQRAFRNLGEYPDQAFGGLLSHARNYARLLAEGETHPWRSLGYPSFPTVSSTLEAGFRHLYNGPGGSTMLITRRFRFSAAHRYYDEALSVEENQRLFGKCASAHGHGHNYVLDVTVRGPLDPKTGMIVNLKDLKAAVDDRVIERYDFKHLNFDVPDFQETQPTTEQIAITIWRLLDGNIPGCELARIRLYESDELFVEYEGQ